MSSGPTTKSGSYTVRRALREAIQQLTSAQVPSASTTAEVLLLHVLERDRTFLYAHPEAELTLEQERAYRHLCGERARGKPTQYLTGRQEFWGLALRVEPGVFIPRPETEHVVEVALQIARERLRKPTARIVDVGTGTGAIALALASELPEAEVVATDISEQALTLARRNAEALGLVGRVEFVKSDLMNEFLSHPGVPAAGFDTRSFDLVVSNPPYVSPEEAARLPREVREHEPASALFSPEEGVAITRRLIDQAAQLLASPRSSAPSAGLVGRDFSLVGRGFSERSGDPEIVEGNPAEQEQVKSGALAPGVDSPAKPSSAGEGHALRSPQGVGGWLILELGYNMLGRVRALLGDDWKNVEVTDDLRGIPRVLAAQKS